MRPEQDERARWGWRPQSLRPEEAAVSPALRVVALAAALAVVTVAMLWLSQEDGPPPAAPVERRAPRRAPEPPPAATQPPTAPRYDPMAQPSVTAPVDRDALPEPQAAPALDSRTRATRLMALPKLPPTTMPLAQALPVLQPRAAAGDGVAACRLAFARARCEAELRSGEVAPQSWCADLDATTLPRTEDLVQPAEPWLTPRQKVLLAMMRPDGGVARLPRPGAPAPEGYVYPQYLADHAYEFLLEGFRSRDPLALEGLAIVHAPGDPARWNRNGPVLPNPKLFLFYTGILQQLNGPDAVGRLALETIASTRATLDPRDVAEADAKAATEVRLWLQARPKAAWEAEWQELVHADLRLQDCAR